MSYSLHIASDVSQEKVNLEVPFTHQPGIDELRQVCETLLTQELVAREGPAKAGSGGFSVGRMQIYDDDATQWVDLVTTAQIHPFDQLYVFPLDLNNISQQRRELPPPRQVQLPRSVNRNHSNFNEMARGGGIGGGSSLNYAAPSAAAAAPPQHRSDSNNNNGQRGGGSSGDHPPHHHQPALVSQYRSASQYSASSNAGGVDAQFGRNPSSSLPPPPISAAVAPSNGNAYKNGNSRGGSSHHVPSAAASPAANRDDKLRFVFDQVDASRKGFIASRDLSDVLNQFGILFSASVLNEMFSSVLDSVDVGQQFRGGGSSTMHWNLVDFTQWSRMYPVTFSVLHNRLYNNERQRELNHAKEEKDTALATMRQRRDDLARQLQEAEQEIESELRAIQNIDGDLHDINNRRSQDDEEEQVIMDKEVSVQHQRAILRREEVDYEQLAERRGLLDHRRSSDSSSAYHHHNQNTNNSTSSTTARSLYNNNDTPRGLNSSKAMNYY